MWLICEFFQIVSNCPQFFQYIYWKKSACKRSHAVQISVVQGSTVFPCLPYYQSLFLLGGVILFLIISFLHWSSILRKLICSPFSYTVSIYSSLYLWMRHILPLINFVTCKRLLLPKPSPQLADGIFPSWVISSLIT